MSIQTVAAERRAQLRSALVAAAEQRIAAQGLGGLRARDLAADAGCAVGAIYNAVQDLDELILAVNSRTLAGLERDFDAADAAGGAADSDPATARLVRLATTYVDFAAAHTHRWRALFEHRLPAEADVPAWYRDVQQRLFERVEEPLRALQPALAADERALLARSLFSAVHGLVALGLEEKLQVVPLPTLRDQARVLVSAIGRGLREGATGE
jgi:AcrR family transcriptional regulator